MKRLFSLLALSALGAAWAQPDSIGALRELLGSGYYALVAQVEGPQVVQAQPQNPEARLLYAQALYLVGNLESAETQLARAKALPSTPQLDHSLTHLDALVRAARGDTETATRLLAQVFKATPDYQVAMDWGQVAWQGGKLKTALRAYRAAAATPKGKTEPWPSLNTARVLLQQGHFKAAIAPLETTLTILERDPSPRPSPAYAEAFYRLGQAHEAAEETQEAVSNYRAARNVDPDYAPAEDALLRLENP